MYDDICILMMIVFLKSVKMLDIFILIFKKLLYFLSVFMFFAVLNLKLIDSIIVLCFFTIAIKMAYKKIY